MKFTWSARVAFLGVLACLGWCGCSSLDPQSTSQPRFHEAAQANLIVQFYSWEHSHILRPDYRQDGFLVPVARTNLSEHLRRLQVDRNLAVVIIGISYNAEERTRLIEGWKDLLFSEGFRRVVCLRGEGVRKVDGLVILDDSRLTPQAGSPQMSRRGSP